MAAGGSDVPSGGRRVQCGGVESGTGWAGTLALQLQLSRGASSAQTPRNAAPREQSVYVTNLSTA